MDKLLKKLGLKKKRKNRRRVTRSDVRIRPVNTNTPAYKPSNDFEQEVFEVFDHAYKSLNLRGCKLRKMRRVKPVNPRGGYRLAYINIQTRIVTLDFYTARTRKPKKISAILNVFAHELAHIQKPPFKQFFKGRWINRIHYPEFYAQVKKNVAIYKSYPELKKYFD